MHPLEYASQIAYSSKEVLQFTFDQAVKYKDSPGVYVECGVAAGAQIIAMAAGAPNKTIYAFDSFEGIPLPSNKDNQMPGIAMLTKAEQMALPDPGKQVLESSGATSVPLEHFLDHIKKSGVNMPERIFPVKGWFENTVPKFVSLDETFKGTWLEGASDIAILRLDGDLYNSTYVCLKYLYPKVIKGGLVIIDDFALPGCYQAVFDYLDSIENLDIMFYDVEYIRGKDYEVAYWTK